jgi:tetratricopeptide (TPR) repeat protein
MKFLKYLLILSIFAPGAVLKAQSGTMQQALDYFQAEQYSLAIPILESLTESVPEYEEAHVLLAASYLRNELPEVADLKAETALIHHSSSATLLWLRGESHVQQQLLKEAIPFYKETFILLEDGGQMLFFPVTKEDISQNLARLYQFGAVTRFRNGMMDGALDYAKRAVEYSPETLEYHMNLLYLSYETGRKEETLRFAQHALERFPGNLDIIRMKASVYYRLEEFESMLREFRKVYESNPDDLDTAMLFAEILLANQQSGEAEQVYENLISLYPEERKVYFALAALYQRRFTLDEKLQTLKLMLERFPDDPEVLAEKADLYELMNDFDNARDVYGQLISVTGDEVMYRMRIAASFEKESSYEQAILVYDGLFRKYPENADLVHAYGWLLADLEMWDDAVEVTSEYETITDDVAFLELKGFAQFKTGDSQNARYSLEKAVSTGNHTARSLYVLSRIIYEESEEAALERITDAIRMVFRDMVFEQQLVETRLRTDGLQAENVSSDHDNLDRLNQLSKEIFSFFTGNFRDEEVLPLLTWMTSTYSTSSMLLSMAGTWFEEKGDYQQSLQHYTDAVRYRPTLTEGHMGMARVFEAQNDPDSAILSYERALGLDMKNPAIYRALIRLYRSEGKLGTLADRWLILLRNHPDNNILREHLIEALHRTDRFDEARELRAGFQ